MSTTTVRIPPPLKARAARIAELAGTSLHSLVLEALEERVTQAEARADFLREGHQRLAEMEATGMAVPWEEARQYLLDRAAGRPAERPAARRLASSGPPADPSTKAQRRRTSKAA